jgi:hypothetical protein
MSEMNEELSPETPEADAMEQHEDIVDKTYVELPQAPFDANEADAVEQRRPVREDTGNDLPRQIPLDANEADAVEQRRSVQLDDDDYR